MTFSESISTCLSKYATFSGRAARSEFWWFALFTLIVNVVSNMIQAIVGDWFAFVGLLVALALLLPSIAVAVRRLHDLDKSGWWYLLVFVPLIGFLVLLYFFVQRGTEGQNQYGADPLR